MSNFKFQSKLTDAELVQKSQNGENDAFSALVHRHQSAACSVAYSICGNISTSEDIAQEAFVSAWKGVKSIRDASQFRAWVCGIAKRTALSLSRKQTRRQDFASNDEPQPTDQAALPNQVAITSEESTLLWSSLENLPESYRQPLVLFYREQQSIADVATALDLTEDTIKQRLSRGRKSLREELSKKVIFTLENTRPNTAFTMAVMNALPPIAVGIGAATAATTAKAATAGSSVGAAKPGTALLGSGIAGTLVSGAVGFFGLYLLGRYLKAIKMPTSIRKIWMKSFVMEVLLSIAFCGFVIWFSMADGHPFGEGFFSPPFLITSSIALFMTGVFALSFRAERTLENLYLEEKLPVNSAKRYRSPVRFFGLPLVSIALGPDPTQQERKGTARGWLAIGDQAYGLIAIGGGLSVGLIALGGISIGILSIGGCTLGLFSLGAVAAGLTAIGGLALGWHLAIGGTAVSHTVSMGGLSVSADQAAGGLIIAPNATSAEALSEQYSVLDTLLQLGPNLAWLTLLAIPIMLYSLKNIKKLETNSVR